MALPPSGTTDEAFLREVDEEYRREQMVGIWRRYGRWIIVGIVVALLALALFLFLNGRSDRAEGERGEQYDAALRLVEQREVDKAMGALDTVAKGQSDGFAALSRIAQGNLLLGKNDAKGAAAKFAEVAGNAGYPQPLRDLALIRQTATEFDTLKPQAVIDRLKPLANVDSPWAGTAGEMVAAAYLKLGNRAEAGKIFGQIAKGGDKVPQSLSQRATQLAGVLGVDAVDQSKENKAQ